MTPLDRPLCAARFTRLLGTLRQRPARRSPDPPPVLFENRQDYSCAGAPRIVHWA